MNPFIRWPLRVVPLLLLGCVPSVHADMRCPPHVVTEGMTLLEVRERCGAPVFEDRRYEEMAPGIWMDVDEWIYEPGSNKFRRLLRFENGRLERIEVLRKPVVPQRSSE